MNVSSNNINGVDKSLTIRSVVGYHFGRHALQKKVISFMNTGFWRCFGAMLISTEAIQRCIIRLYKTPFEH